MRLFPVVLGACHLLAASAQDVTCYKPDGTSRTFNGTELCNSVDGSVSMCCGWNDQCLQNGLCKSKLDNKSYWRDMCSISSWPEVGCLKACTDEGQIDEVGNAQMTPCDGTDYSEKWCCGDNTDCCGTGDEIIVPTNIYVSSTATSTSASESPTSTSTTTGTGAIASPSPEESPESGLSTGAKAGIGVGVGAGVVIVLGVVAFLVIRRRRRKGMVASGTTLDSSAQPGVVPQVPQELSQTPVYEKPADKQDTRYELPAQPSTADR
ncbi:hypothetical protein ASPVEDRAFT_46799 [Aspergillus versicolor CBS 583.65]|uniref:Mid2 domain-containing protein n=1 Tax=Aspergillus versicolor CBS 583.65 TaxID=1036611 RepID=A0A1L9Q169_ASPVE|nr:uncharacterized protein ASPVEDRAFT_46799 [Aspergillus versicolor CBS 583.65]OJJ07501.1 hypothetical protein ASPVEDRAFT_46799 [Aspergillus versicolor CBS 583.65]